MDFLRRTWAEINLNRLIDNVKEIQNLLNANCKMMAVIKADAYGHGDAMLGKHLYDEGIRFFGVSSLDEAISLRRTVPESEILILGFTPADLSEKLVEYQCTQTVFSLDFAKKLSEDAKKKEVIVSCHLKIDTGMGRLGLVSSDFEKCISEAIEILSLPNLKFTGIFTHFSCADEEILEATQYTKYQFEQFCKVCEVLEEKGFSLGIRHACNSAATLRFPEMHLDMVRPGLILYGISPIESDIIPLEPVMTVKSAIAMVKEVPKNTYLSYGRTFQAKEKMKIATFPLGYADGYSRVLSGKAELLLKGNRVSILGRICMDQLVADVSDLQVLEGEEAIVFGKTEEGEISASQVAEWAGTIPYEVICMLGKRVPRVYYKDGDQIAVTRYKYMKY